MGPLESAPTGPAEAREPIRISDADRAEAVQRINGHFTDGRLDFDECSARLDEIYAAKTDVDLERVFRDLPKPSAVPAKPPRFRSARTRVERAIGMATPAIICTAVWAMTGHDSSFWPQWVWFGTGVGLLGSVRRDQRRNRRAELLGTSGHLPPGTGGGQRLVLTAVFADIVGSTERASTLGDRRWREFLDGFEHAAHDGMSRHDGRELFTKGDEVVGTFRSPGQAVAYARELRDQATDLGFQLRIGLHTGELEKRQGDLSGIALHIGQRVSELAVPDEILVSSTVRDLVHGGGTDFVDRGEHELRGLPGSFHLYAVR